LQKVFSYSVFPHGNAKKQEEGMQKTMLVHPYHKLKSTRQAESEEIIFWLHK